MRAALATLAVAATLAAQAPVPRLGPVTFGGQADLVWQGYPSFPAAYSGPLSLPSASEFHNSRVLTLTTATALSSAWRLELDLEAANGFPLGQATGLAGISNLDVTRNLATQIAPQIYLARLYLERAFGRAHLKVGRFSLADDFDANAVLGADHYEFMNWTMNQDLAWDYAADTRGYTDAVEWHSGAWRVAYGLMPVTPNGMRLNWRTSQLVVQRNLDWRRLALRILGYATHAPLGAYALAGTNIDGAHRWRWKPGAELSADTPLTSSLSLGVRLGADDDALEEIAFTEAANTASVGLAWHRGGNRLGLALASNGLSAAHAAYLARGGQGFLLGDGALAYGRETIAEAYALRRLRPGLDWGPDLQFIRNPGYNHARGPVWIAGLRLHAWF
jgi:high affinity Mn2+ porin